MGFGREVAAAGEPAIADTLAKPTESATSSEVEQVPEQEDGVRFAGREVCRASHVVLPCALNLVDSTKVGRRSLPLPSLRLWGNVLCGNYYYRHDLKVLPQLQVPPTRNQIF